MSADVPRADTATATVKVPTILRTYTKGEAQVAVPLGRDATLAGLLD